VSIASCFLHPAFDQKLVEIMLTKRGTLPVLEFLAKLNREIGSRADEAPAARDPPEGDVRAPMKRR
jgi:hypothetical protein